MSQVTPKSQRAKVKLIDMEKCFGCELCEKVCEFLQNEPGVKIHSTKEGVLVPITCMHCINPVCVDVCPAGGIYKSEEGGIKVRPHNCIGCRLCAIACPLGVPKINQAKGIVQKCDLCNERAKEGLAPACVEVCPAGAILYGEYEDVVKKLKAKTFNLMKKLKVLNEK